MLTNTQHTLQRKHDQNVLILILYGNKKQVPCVVHSSIMSQASHYTVNTATVPKPSIVTIRTKRKKPKYFMNFRSKDTNNHVSLLAHQNDNSLAVIRPNILIWCCIIK